MREKIKNLRLELEALAEPEFQAFSSRLMPGVEGILGVRLPILRRIAKGIAKGDWKQYLEEAADDSYEEILLQGMVLGYAKGTLADKEPYLRLFIPKINNWSACDSFCAGLKLAKEEPEAMWEFLQPYLHSREEYEIRFGVVMLLDYYIRPEYLEQSFQILEEIAHPAYYVRMAVAWALSMYYVAFPKETEAFFQRMSLDAWTYDKALQKIIESRQIGEETRKELRRHRCELKKKT